MQDPVRIVAALMVFAASACGGGPPDESSARTDAGAQTTIPNPPGLPTSTPPAKPTHPPTTPLETLRLGVVGRWTGAATMVPRPGPAPTGPSSWSVWFDLFEDGVYAAGCIDTSCVAALGEGNDGHWPTKRYAIYDLGSGPGGAGVGEIYILLGGDGLVEPTLRRAELSDVRLSSDGGTLTFQLTKGGGLTPAEIRYELRRMTP